MHFVRKDVFSPQKRKRGVGGQGQVMNTATIKMNFFCFSERGRERHYTDVLRAAQEAGVSVFSPHGKAMGFFAYGANDRYAAGVRFQQQHVEGGILDIKRESLQNSRKEIKVADFGVQGLDIDVRSHTPSVLMVGRGEMSVRLLTILFGGKMGIPQFLEDGGKGVLLPGGGNWMTRFGEGGRFGVAHMVAGFPAGHQSVLIIPTIMDGKVVVHVLRREECNSTLLEESEFSSRLEAPRESQLQLWGCS